MADYTTVLGMDLLAFFLAVVSCLGLAVSTLTFLRTYTPTNLYLYAADSVAQTRALYERLESADFFSSEAHRVNHLGSHLDKWATRVYFHVFLFLLRVPRQTRGRYKGFDVRCRSQVKRFQETWDMASSLAALIPGLWCWQTPRGSAGSASPPFQSMRKSIG